MSFDYSWKLRETLTRTEAAKHSLLKWKELLRLRKRAETRPDSAFAVLFDNSGSSTCALCALFFHYGREREGSCRGCPLFEIGYGCVPEVYKIANRKPKYRGDHSPYVNVVDNDRSFSVIAITRMVKHLEKAVAWAKKHEDGTQYSVRYV